MRSSEETVKPEASAMRRGEELVVGYREAQDTEPYGYPFSHAEMPPRSQACVRLVAIGAIVEIQVTSAFSRCETDRQTSRHKQTSPFSI